MPVKRTLQIFRTGKHTDANGITADFTDADLTEMATSYQRTTHFAPLVAGHPKGAAPAYGGLDSVTKVGDKLFGDFLMEEEVARQIDGYQWLGVSCSIYARKNPHNPTPGKLNIRHVGLCGDDPPAIKGMQGLQQFAEGDTAEAAMEFAELSGWMVAYPLDAVADMLRRLRDHINEKEGLDAADNLLPDWKITAVKDAAAALRDADAADQDRNKNPSFKEPENMSIEQELATAKAEAAALKARNGVLEREAKAKDKASAEADNLAFCEGLVQQRKLLPSQVALTLANLNFMAAQDPAKDGDWLAAQVGNFAEGVVAPSRFAAQKAALEAIKPMPDFLFSEQATKTKVGNAGAGTDKSALIADAERRAVKP
jgi:hypothetical protein